jgi:hypothetical protein
MDSRIAPSFHVPKNTAAVSGDAGATTATRSPRCTPRARSTLAARFDSDCSSPQSTRRSLPCQSAHTIASLSRGCLSHTSRAML